MFYVRDNYQDRRSMILKFKNEQDICIAIILAAADFEWTIRRIILSLSQEPNTVVRKDKRYLRRCSGLGDYKSVWNLLIAKNPKLVNPDNPTDLELQSVIKDWNSFKQMYKYRHGIVHGFKANLNFDEGCKALDSILKATDNIYNFSQANGYDVFTKVKVVRKPR